MTLDPNFSAYLEFLKTYQELVRLACAFGALIVLVGVALTWQMRKNPQKGEKGEAKVFGYKISYTSSHAGALVCLCGAMITSTALWVLQFTVPKPEFSQTGWKTASTNNVFDLEKVSKLQGIKKQSALLEARVLARGTTTSYWNGYIAPASIDSELKSAGIRGLAMPSKVIPAEAVPWNSDSIFVLQSEFLQVQANPNTTETEKEEIRKKFMAEVQEAQKRNEPVTLKVFSEKLKAAKKSLP